MSLLTSLPKADGTRSSKALPNLSSIDIKKSSVVLPHGACTTISFRHSLTYKSPSKIVFPSLSQRKHLDKNWFFLLHVRGFTVTSNDSSSTVRICFTGVLLNILEKLKVEYKTNLPSFVINPDAYEFYLKAKHKFDNRKNKEDIEITRGLLNKAIELDENLIKA